MHPFSSLALGLALCGLVTTSPVEKRGSTPLLPNGDADILNYALTLEYLERKFYQEGLANYSAAEFDGAGYYGFYTNLKEIYVDEETHVSALNAALVAANYAPVLEATYSFPSTNVKSFVALASVLEGVGVSAYLGAAASIVNKEYLTVAGAILTIEARHSSYLRKVLGESPFPKPFDTPLDFDQVYSMAAQFITGFAKGSPALPFKAFPHLTIMPSPYPYTAGSSPVTFTHAQQNAIAAGLIKANTPVYAVFFSGLDVYYVKTRTTRGNSGDLKIDMIPAGGGSLLPPAGQVYVVLSTADGNTKVSDENTISGVGLIEVVPAWK